MNLRFFRKDEWPKLSWVATCAQGEDTVDISHGPMVECGGNWLLEGVWDGDYDSGDFDLTDTIFGTGIRLREEMVTFVSSATGIDRLWYCRIDQFFYIANTLPGLLSVTGLSLRPDYPFYTSDIESVQKQGIFSCKRSIPSSGQDIQLLYYNNLMLSRDGLSECEKPDRTPDFGTFRAYEDYLRRTAVKLGENARARERRFRIDMLVGLSAGYDSIATAVIARHAGCTKAASIRHSSSLWRGSDSGEKFADLLGMECRSYDHDKRAYRNEIALWAAAGREGGRNFTLFDYPKPLCLFFSGGYGDAVWDRNAMAIDEPKGGINELLCEFRLIEGIFVSVVPWWGIRRARQIQDINRQEEMKPWTLGSSYDRPVARRIIEQAGIPRGSFALRKMNTASNSALRWPSTKPAIVSLKEYLKRSGYRVPSSVEIRAAGSLAHILNLAYKNLARPIGIKKWWRPWMQYRVRSHFFEWANHELRENRYTGCLSDRWR